MERLGRHNLARLAEESFARHGGEESLVFEGRAYSAQELFDRARRVAEGLRGLGVEPGDRVVVMMANCPEVVVAYHAVWRAGAVLTPAIFLLPPPELRRILVDSEACGVITTPEFAQTVSDAAADADTVRWLVSTGQTADGPLALSALGEAAPGPIVPRADGEPAALLYTGGTTGRAKGVMLSHENLWLAGESGHRAGYVPGVTRSLVTLPLSHAYGLLVTAVGLHGPEPGHRVLLRWFDAATALGAIQEHALQAAALVPSMIQALISLPLEDYDLHSLRYVVSGASPLPREVADAFRDRVPGVELREGYGLTESSALVSTNPPGNVKLGSVGKPVPGVDVKIVDDDGRELRAGEIGEICCRSKLVMLGYWRAPELTAEVLRGGWLHTGDMGYVDDEGYLYVVDRKKDLIIRGGFNIFPRDVEDALLEHPAVALAGVVGTPDARHGEEVVAFVSLRAGADVSADELVTFARERVGGVKYPREVRVVASVPLTPVGKVDRKALRALAQTPPAEAARAGAGAKRS